MQFYFIRHGQSTNNALWDRIGSGNGRSEDPELTDVGQQQARQVAGLLGRSRSPARVAPNDPKNVTGFRITHLYCSPMVRAVDTGTHIASALNLPLTVWKDLHETGGIFLDDPVTKEHIGLPGNTRAYLQQRFPDLVLPDAIDGKGWWNRPFETPEERPVRAQRVLRELVSRHGGTDDRVAVVSHGGFYNHLMDEILVSHEPAHWFAMNNTAITRIDFERERTQVTYMNRTDFLSDELIT
jgi:2,3-bisphosphoglycerate-dependent phosphoglycerate mutase